MKPRRSTSCRALLLLGLLCPASIMAQDVPTTTRTHNGRPAKQVIKTETKGSPCFEARLSEQRKQRENEAIENLPATVRFWLTEDVADIISREERCAFLQLTTDRERDQFIEQFWSRRAPDPKSLDNSSKREHYERIVFANEKYGGQVPGWKTDRGRVYVTFGPPDSIESHRAGEKTGRPPEEGVETYQYSWEGWHYRHLEGVRENLELEFVDPSESGDYRLAMPPEMKDESIFAPSYNLGRSSHGGATPKSAQSIELYIGPAPTPLVQFKDLEAMVVSRIIREQVHFSHRIEFAKATHATTFTKILITIPSNQLNFPNNKADSPIEFEIFGRVSKPSGWVVETFERRISIEGQRNSDHSQPDCQFNVAVAPGTYRLAIVVKHLGNGETGTRYTAMDVPPYEKINSRK